MATAEAEHDVAAVVQRRPDDIGNVRPADRTVRPRARLMTGPPAGFPQSDYRRGKYSELRNGTGARENSAHLSVECEPPREDLPGCAVHRAHDFWPFAQSEIHSKKVR